MKALFPQFNFYTRLLFCAMYQANSTNLVYNNVSLHGSRFSSYMTTKELFLLSVKNSLLILLTLGLYAPWAKINLLRYRCNHIQLRY